MGEREDAILEHKAPFDRVTEVRAVIECVLADKTPGPAANSLRRSPK